MTVFGLDYSAARPDPQCLAANGVRFVSRYLSRAAWKNLTLAEAKALSRVGIQVMANWETFAEMTKGGYDAGFRDAGEADAMATACGMPSGRPIYFSVDFDARGTDLDASMRYLDGAAARIGRHRVGVYGSHRTIARAVDGVHARWFWQTYAWSNGLWHPAVDVQQYRNNQTMCGGAVDFNRALNDDFGGWFAQEDDMSYDPNLLVPWGYGTEYKPLREIRTILLQHHHPEYVRRVLAWLTHKAGKAGVGGTWRAGGAQPSRPGFAPEGRSFHQDQNYADGFTGACAVDVVAPDGPDGNHTHDTVAWAEVPRQGSAEARRWGIHANVSTESWHIQPIEIDGWLSWWNAGRPAPVAGYPLPGAVAPPPPVTPQPPPPPSPASPPPVHPPTQLPTLEDADMSLITTDPRKGDIWVVSTDLAHKMWITAEINSRLAASGRYVFVQLDADTLDRIPDARVATA